MKLLAVDPGSLRMGVALFEDEELLYCNLWQSKHSDLVERTLDYSNMTRTLVNGYGVPDFMIVELMQVYSGAQQVGNPNSLIQVATVAGAVVAAANPLDADFVTPRTWKGGVPKEIHNARTMSKLEPEEKLVLQSCKCPKSLLHNVVDAVGLGLWSLDR